MGMVEGLMEKATMALGPREWSLLYFLIGGELCLLLAAIILYCGQGQRKPPDPEKEALEARLPGKTLVPFLPASCQGFPTDTELISALGFWIGSSYLLAPFDLKAC